MGKTALMRMLAARVDQTRLTGFYTQSIYENDLRVGFSVHGYEGSSVPVANTSSDSAVRVGKFGVDLPALDDIMTRLLVPCAERPIYFMDELGKLECKSRVFCESMERLLSEPVTAVISAPLKGPAMLEKVLSHSAVMRIRVSEQNAQALFAQLVPWLDRQQLRP